MKVGLEKREIKDCPSALNIDLKNQSLSLFPVSSRHYLRDSFLDHLEVLLQDDQRRKLEVGSRKFLEIPGAIYFYALHSRDDVIYSF